MKKTETVNPLEGERIDECGRDNRVYGNGLQSRGQGSSIEKQSQPNPRKNDEKFMTGL